MAHEAGQKNPPPPLKKRLRSILTMIVGRETNGVISWVVNFRSIQSSRYVNLWRTNKLPAYLSGPSCSKVG